MAAPPRTTRRITAAAALTCIAALTTACSSTSGSSVAPAKRTTTTAGNSPSTVPSSTTPTTAVSAPAGLVSCATRYLGAKLGLAQGTAGSVYQVIDFTNISNVSCTLYGYPGISLAAGTPVTQIGLAATENSTTPRQLVTLAPGAVANALLQITDAHNYPASTCGPATTTYLQIIPPNQSTPIYLRYTSTGCAKAVHLMAVNTIVPGSGGG
jgi:Protein of unknown function (DUF4232)